MYFEAREHKSFPVKDPAEAIQCIHNNTIAAFQCPVWKNNLGQRIALVNDSHIDCHAWFETALINLDTLEQIDTLTFGWCKTETAKLQLVKDSLEGTFILRKNIAISIDNQGKDNLVTFECGCCGSCFDSTISKQKQFDQDAGFGICPRCAQQYYIGINAPEIKRAQLEEQAA